MTDIKPTKSELLSAVKLLNANAEFVPVANSSAPARLLNGLAVINALVDGGWIAPSAGKAATGGAHPTEFLVQRGVSIIRATAKCDGVQPNGKVARLKNERELVEALLATGWLEPGSLEDYGFVSPGLASIVHSRPTAA